MFSKMTVILDPRTKIIMFISWFSLAFICRDIYSISVLLASSIIVLLLTGSSVPILKKMKYMLPLILFAWPLWTFLNQWSLFYSSGKGIDPYFGLLMMLRLLLIVIISLAFIYFVKPVEIIKAVSSLKLPSSFGAVLALAFRNLYIIAEDYKSIKEAHTSRGLELDRGSLITRIKNHIPLLIPLIIRSIDSAEKLVLSLELRPNIMKKRKMEPLKTIDIVIVIGCILILFLTVYYNYYVVTWNVS